MTPDRKPSEVKFHEAARNLILIERAPSMLDALRLIHFAVSTDHDSVAVMRKKIRKLCEAALRGTEDL